MIDQRNDRLPVTVLFTHYGDEWLRGSEIVLLDLLKAVNKDRIHPVVWCNGAEMAAAATAAGYPTYRSEFRYFLDYDSPALNLRSTFSLIRQCRKICSEHGVRVLHSNSAAPCQWLVPAGLTARLPVLVHLHTDYLRRSRYGLLLHAATLAVGVSRYVIEGLLADGVAPSRTRVIYNGIDTARLAGPSVNVRSELEIPACAIVITTIGSLIPRKGHDLLIRAFHALPLQSPLTYLLIVGEGPEKESLKQLAKSLGVSDRVRFLGETDNPARVYQAADVFALASRADAFGLVLAEAGLFGLASVSTRVGGIPEVILHEQTGLLVPPEDIKSFSGALSRLIRDHALRARLGAAALARVRGLFTVQRMARQFEDTYSALAMVPSSQLGWKSVLKNSAAYVQLITGCTGPRGRHSSTGLNQEQDRIN